MELIKKRAEFYHYFYKDFQATKTVDSVQHFSPFNLGSFVELLKTEKIIRQVGHYFPLFALGRNIEILSLQCWNNYTLTARITALFHRLKFKFQAS